MMEVRSKTERDLSKTDRKEDKCEIRLDTSFLWKSPLVISYTKLKVVQQSHIEVNAK